MKYKTLVNIWHELNREIFFGLLKTPRFFATRSDDEMASYLWTSKQSIIFFNARAIKGYWARSIVYHEMIHQYLEEFLQVEEQDHHGEQFERNYRLFAPQNVILFAGFSDDVRYII